MKIVITLFSLFLSVTITALIMDFGKTSQNAIGWVWQDRNGVAIKELLEEKNGCVYYIDVWGNNGKTCGDYQLTIY